MPVFWNRKPQSQKQLSPSVSVFDGVATGASAAIEQIVVDDCTLDLKSNDTGHVRVPAPYKSVTITQFIKSKVDVIDSPKLRELESMTSTDWYELDPQNPFTNIRPLLSAGQEYTDDLILIIYKSPHPVTIQALFDINTNDNPKIQFQIEPFKPR